MYVNSANPTVIAPSGLTYTWTPQASPSPVRTFAATTGVTASGANLSWTAPAGATQYNVQYRAVGSCTWTNWSGNPVMTNSLALTGLNSQTVYQFRVQSSNGTLNAIYSHSPNLAGTGNGYAAAGSFTTASLPCAGAPDPGNTTGLSSICSGKTFTLALQNFTSGLGISYVWQSADDLAFTVNVATVTGTNATVSTSETASKYYRAGVTCSGSGITTYSNPLFVALNAPAMCPCVPTSTFGCTDGDVIARVTLNTLDNNSGTGCPSGVAGYTDYTSTPGLTTTLQAGSNYNCTVYAGQYSEAYAAWIDYNDDGVFDNTTERIGFTPGLVTGSGTAGVLGSSASFPINVACNPPIGVHRLRVRCMYDIGGVQATSGSGVTPCTVNQYGEIEDYLVTITAAVACPQPFNLGSNTVTSTTANLTWSVGCAETAWEVAVQPVNSGVPAGSGTPTASTTFPATYTAGTANEFYVRADCGGGSFSTWTGPFVFTAPACTTAVAPTDGQTGVVLTAGAYQFSWAASAGATTYDVWLGTTSGALNNLGNIGATTVQITGLLPSTQYFWRIDPKNSNGTAAGCTEFTFTTLVAYCTPAPTSVDGSGITNVSFGTINNTTTAETGNYGDYSAQVTDVVSTVSVPVNITLSTGFAYNVKVWVDWNDDKDFNDTGEEVYSGTSLSADPTTLAASFLVTGGLGQHKLRIGGVDGTPTPCYTGSFGTFEDYTINVLPPPPCVAPTALGASNVTTTTADISWTASVSNPTDGYDYEVRSSGAAGSGTTGLGAFGSVGSGVVTASVSGLTTETNYTIYVRSVCTTGSDMSNWAASAATFRTGYCAATYTNGHVNNRPDY
ncbi:GEVED domain-containing protein [Flavobacterium sp. 3HN19-14]|uniref:GEVED domain-containing protein n=1 Tax=Flavobacterium sp. 3HN19-14 TaxID=3448133 RepID=UPI003EE1EE0B